MQRFLNWCVRRRLWELVMLVCVLALSSMQGNLLSIILLDLAIVTFYLLMKII